MTETKKRQLPVWQESILLVVTAMVMAVIVKTFFLQAFYIPSESMEPGLVKNDRILVQKVSYWGGGGPQRGDVVVFEDPGGWLGPEDVTGPVNPVAKALEKIGLYPSGGHLVKRVIGVAGDTIVCCDSLGRLSVNGTSVDEKGYTLPGEIDQPPALWVIDAQHPDAAVSYAIGSPFDRVAVSPDGKLAIAYFSASGSDPDGEEIPSADCSLCTPACVSQEK